MAMEDASEKEKDIEADNDSAQADSKLVEQEPLGEANEMKRVGDAADSAEVLKRWDEIKRTEKGPAGESILDGIGEGLPGLLRAEKTQKRAAKVGFDWSELPPVIAKVREELAEVEAAMSDPAKVEEEIGDLLFAVVNLARKLKVDGEVALQRATEKFATRFKKIEAISRDRSLVLEKMSLAEMDVIWDEVKAKETR